MPYSDKSESVNLAEANLRDKITSIRRLVRSLEERLRGSEWSEKGESFIYTGRPLCGSEVIAKATGLLQAFTEESNLITTKEDKTFSKQKWRVSKVFNRTCLLDNTVTAENYPTVVEMFRDTLQNIGDVILKSKGTMNSIFTQEDERGASDEY